MFLCFNLVPASFKSLFFHQYFWIKSSTYIVRYIWLFSWYCCVFSSRGFLLFAPVSFPVLILFSCHSVRVFRTTLVDVCLFVCLIWVYGISTFAGYSMPNQIFNTDNSWFETIQFNIRKQFNCQNICISSYSV